MFAFELECLRKSGWCFQRDWENIEELYTQADLRRLANIQDKGNPELLCDSIAWSIWDTYRFLGNDLDIQHFVNHMKAVLPAIRNNGYKPVVITTNYDLMVEVATLQKNGDKEWKYYYPGFNNPTSYETMDCVISTQNDELPPSGNYLPVIKLHGSANWFQFRSSDTWVASLRIFDEYPGENLHFPNLNIEQFRETLITNANQWTRSGILRDSIRDEPFRPAIIPPMLGKMSVSPVIARQWRAAIEALRSAREIWIIGYSFPETDSFMPRLLSEGIQDNDDLDLIMVVNTNTGIDQLKDRLGRILTPTVNANRTLYSGREGDHSLYVLGTAFKNRKGISP